MRTTMFATEWLTSVITDKYCCAALKVSCLVMAAAREYLDHASNQFAKSMYRFVTCKTNA